VQRLQLATGAITVGRLRHPDPQLVGEGIGMRQAMLQDGEVGPVDKLC
jgi:hypothetical protein